MLKNIQLYKEMVDTNQHTEVLIQIAEDYKIVKYVELFKAIKTIQDKEGYMPHNLLIFRRQYGSELLTILFNLVTTKDYEQLLEFI